MNVLWKEDNIWMSHERPKTKVYSSNDKIQKFQKLSSLLEDLEMNKFGNIMTNNKNWLIFESQDSAKWNITRKDVPATVR
jgi:hypothetical protein